MTDERPDWMTDERLDVLRLVCNTVVPAVDRPEDPTGFWARTGTDLGVDLAVVQLLAGLPDESREGLLGLLDALGAQGFGAASALGREELLRRTALLGPATTAGVGALVSAILFLAYGVVDPATGQNPMWQQFGYPGPTVPVPSGTKTIEPVVPEGDLELTADVVIVGSGAGGGLIAGRLAQAGRQVVVVEASGYYDQSDFDQVELATYQRAFWRGGPTKTADQNVSLQAGTCLGGGTTINWTNCLRTRPWVRTEWATEHGLEGLDSPEYERRFDAVAERMSINDRCSEFNGPNLRLKEAAEALGWDFDVVWRNTNPATYTHETAGYLGLGDPTGSKQGTLHTYLQDAYDAGAKILVHTHADTVVVEEGRAAGVEATYTDPATGRSSRVTVRAPRVVVACGALESPALLLRSKVGGPAVGKYLRLHPVIATVATYPEPQDPWSGACMTGLIKEFEQPEDGYGFLLEAAQYVTAAGAAFVPWLSGEQHKQAMAAGRNKSWTIGLMRDHGWGQVTIDENGESVVTYALDDEIDLATVRRCVDALARQAHAAGAIEISALAEGLPTWRYGDDLEEFIARLQAIPPRAGGYRMFSAHQMGSCRMGTDPETSVAGPYGEVHDTPGLWIGDGSAFPTPSGTNPMFSILALADRTADALIADIKEAQK